MKILSLILLIISPWTASSQSKPLRIVFDVTSKDTLTHQAVLRHVKEMASSYPTAELEVVIYGNAWPMAVTGNSTTAKAISALSGNPNVSFKICAMTLARYQVDRESLVHGVDAVPDAILEIVTRQGEGWGYIKESHN